MKLSLALVGLQANFADAILGGDLSQVVPHLVGDPATVQGRLAIYRRSMLANRRGALRSAFPVVVRVVGDVFFDEMAFRYGEAAPPESADLNRYGSYMPEFLAAYAHAKGMPWLPDVARLEWAWHESLKAEDAVGLDFVALACAPEENQERLRFLFHPGVHLVRSR